MAMGYVNCGVVGYTKQLQSALSIWRQKEKYVLMRLCDTK